MKICKYCQEELLENQKVCPSCGKKQNKLSWKWVIGGVAVFFIFISLTQTQQENIPIGISETTSASSQPQKERTEFSQDEIVNLDDVLYQVQKVERTKGTEYIRAKSGQEYVIVSIRIENKSSDKISYNPFDWKMENSQGQETDPSLVSLDDTRLGSGALSTGGVVEGTIMFEQPQNDENLKLRYYNNIFDKKPLFTILLS